MTERDILDEWNAVVATQEAPRGSIMWKVLDAAKRVVGMLEARVQHGSRLLRQVVIRDGCGAWTSDAARDAWCSSLKDYQNGATHIDRDFEVERLEREARFWAQACAAQINENGALRHVLLDVKRAFDEMPDLARLRGVRDRLAQIDRSAPVEQIEIVPESTPAAGTAGGGA